MANKHVLTRLHAIQQLLIQAHGGGEGMPSACIGSERESFINLALANIIAPPFRIGSGAITDAAGHLTGQLDVVIEYQVSVSFPLLVGDSPRLYLAEPICAVIEIKSDICGKWDEVLATARKLRSIERAACLVSGMGDGLPQHIPFFAVGYEGWTSAKAASEHVNDASGYVDGILAIKPGIYVGRHPKYSNHSFSGERALFGLFLSLEQLMSDMILMKPPYRAYVTG